MHRIYEKSAVKNIESRSPEDVRREKKQKWFVVKSELTKATDKNFLGFLWLILEPLFLSLIYLFVFTVIKARIAPGSIFIGITLYRVFQSSIIAGTKIVNSVDGGIRCERIDSNVILKAAMIRRSIESILATIPTSLILVFGFGITWEGGIVYILIAQLMAFLFFGIGLCLAGLVKRIPDLSNVLFMVLRLGFFVSPAIYPMHKMSGIHYTLNEYNPFSYVAEGARYVAGEISTFDDLKMTTMATIFSIVILLNIWAFNRFDKLRWRVSTWS
jgi:ABC-type polysaccharide/polyol phosphate export permease